MTGNYGAIAEGFFESHGWLTSLGKAGVNENRELKDDACRTLTSAKIRALRSVANKLRYGRHNGQWIEFRSLNYETQKALLKEVNNSVSWETFGDISYAKNVSYSDFNNAFSRFKLMEEA